MGDRIEYEPVPNWGKIPHGMTFRGSATSVAVDSLDRVYVFNRGNHPLMVFDPYGNLLRTWGSPDQFKRPHSIAIDEHDHVFLVDDGGHTIEKRTLDGELIFTLGKRGEPAPWQSGGMFNRPTDVAVHRRTGELFISDGYGNSRVHRFSPEGEHLLSWGEPGADPGQFSLPHSIVVTPDDRVVVADRENFRVQVFDLDGSFIEQWHLYRPAAVASDTQSGLRFYVGEHSPHKIQKGVPRLGCRIKVLDEAGNELARFGGELPGHEPDQFMDPHGIAVDSSGDVYVAEVCNSWLLSLDGPPPLGEWPSLRKWRLIGN
jgi:sugar lactone lactonase YvrE